MTVAIGFLGCGFIAGYHAAMLAGAVTGGGPDARIVAAHDPDPGRAEAFTAAHGGRVLPDEDAVIEASDAVYVTTWTTEHRRLVERVAAAGRAVFVEKPLGVTAADAAAMAGAVAAAGVVNQVGLVLRDSPAFLLLRHLVHHPAGGRLMSVVFRDDQYLPVQGLYGSTWRGDASRAGAGTLLEHSIHDLDLLRWIGGPVAEVSARTTGFHGLPGIEDVAVVTLAFAGGGLASLTSVWHDVLARPSMRRVEVFRERAHHVLAGDVEGPVSWTVDDRPAAGAAPVPGGSGAGRPGDPGSSGSRRGEALRRELVPLGLEARNPDAAFVAAVATGAPAHPAVADAVGAHVLADAAYRSAAAGGAPVAVPADPADPADPAGSDTAPADAGR